MSKAHIKANRTRRSSGNFKV